MRGQKYSELLQKAGLETIDLSYKEGGFSHTSKEKIQKERAVGQ